MAEEILTKCPKCRSDVFSGQRFCAGCGAEQKVPMKTSEQIQQMRGSLRELCRPKGEGGMPTLVISLATFIAADTALKWAMGHATDEEMRKISDLPKGEDDAEHQGHRP